ncbi:MAG TPA: transcriptional repressor [Solirubrobacterales bacterium]|nr:transcriptional repressor [Solirubrobacterales bacterium]
MARGPAADWERHARAALTEAGHRSGGARDAVVGLLARQDCCLSAQEIHQRLRRAGGDAGIASVYRALYLLHDMGLVQRVEFGDRGARFEPVVPGGEHHHHAVCDRCGRVTPFEDARLEKQLEQLAGNLKHSMSGHDLVIHGECRRCAGS